MPLLLVVGEVQWVEDFVLRVIRAPELGDPVGRAGCRAHVRRILLAARIPVGWSGRTSAPGLTLGPQGLCHKRTPHNMGSLGLGLGGPVRLSRVELS